MPYICLMQWQFAYSRSEKPFSKELCLILFHLCYEHLFDFAKPFSYNLGSEEHTLRTATWDELLHEMLSYGSNKLTHFYLKENNGHCLMKTPYKVSPWKMTDKIKKKEK